MMFDRRYFCYFDWTSFFLMLGLLGIGLLFDFSSTYTPENPISTFFKKQLFGAIFGIGIFIFFSFKNLRKLARTGFFVYFLIILLLIYTIIGGWIGLGAKRWISLYFIRFQPSELAKLFFPFFVAHYFCANEVSSIALPKTTFKDFVFPLIVLFVSFVLILKQPDLGTALIILLCGFILFWFIGLNRSFFIAVSLFVAVSTPFLWHVLKPYQQKRILVLFGYGDPRKERYQVEQSKIAIGSGGIIGKGILKGTQNKLGFLPEDHTDFIFSVICEEVGFIGALIIILLFGLLFSRIVQILIQIPAPFEQIIGVGMLLHILLSVCINIGMVTGMLPTVGIPLPLVTYGLTNLWTTLASLGVLNNIAIRRFLY